MAQYWCGYSDGTITPKYSAINELYLYLKEGHYAPGLNVHAEGNDIDYKELFNFLPVDRPKKVIENVTDSTIDLPQDGLYNLAFVNCSFDNLSLLDIKTNNDYTFSDCKIDKLKFIGCQGIHNLIIENGCIISDLEISNVISIETIEIKLSSIIRTSISTKIDLNDFLELKTIRDSIQYLIVLDSTLEFFKISRINIINQIYLSLVKDSEIIIDNSTLHCGKSILHRLNNSVVKFSSSIFNESIQILEAGNSSRDSKLILDLCSMLGETSFINLSKLANSGLNINIYETIFKEFVTFDENYIFYLQIEGTHFQNNFFLPKRFVSIFNILLNERHYISTPKNNGNSIINSVHSSVWVLLKHQAIQKNDIISALKYKRYEMNSYEKEIKKDGTNYDRIVLWLNRVSNSHGLNWGKGVGFTFIVLSISFPIYFWASCDLSLNSSYKPIFYYKEFWLEAVQFLWLPSGMGNFSKYVKSDISILSSVSLIVSFLIGKILIGYGIFQTISAFRKHGKI